MKNLSFKYLIFGKEVGENGTPHLQGFIRFENAKSFAAVKKLLGIRYHIESQRGSCEQAIDYCKKEGNFEEVGVVPLTPKEKGSKNKKRYERAWELAKSGDIEEIDADIRIKCYSVLLKIRGDYRGCPSSIDELRNEWYWGATGTGKSRKARKENPGAFIKNLNKWWCRYKGEDVVIIEEWSPNHECLASYLKIWCDHYAFRGEIKGSSMMLRPRKIIVTSNYHPNECFSRSGDLEPILRRFRIVHFANL